MQVVALPGCSGHRATAKDSSPAIRQILDSAGPMILAMDTSGFFLDTNVAASRILGLPSAAALRSVHLAEVLMPGEAALWVAALRRSHAIAGSLPEHPDLSGLVAALASLPSGESATVETRLRRQDGSPLPARLHLSALRDEDNNRHGMVAVAIEQAPVQPRADDLKRKQEILLESVADGICGADRHGRVSFANPAAARLLGAPMSALIGLPLHVLLHGKARGEDACPPLCPLRAAMASPVACAGEMIAYRADGSPFPAEYCFTPIVEAGNFSGSVLSFRDISQRSALDQLKDEFISTVSHELRTPLTSVRGALGLLSSGILGELNEKAANLLRIALTNSDRLVRLINDLLDLEHIQSGRAPISFRPLQLAEIVRQAVEGMQPVAEAGGVLLAVDEANLSILGDADRLLQVLTNLLSNAIKFSPPRSTVAVRVEPGVVEPGITGVTVSVIDEGRGIPADKLESIFGRFQQVDATDASRKGGTGLGLSICRSIVSQHAGRIWAERNAERGSTFRVFLPYDPAILHVVDRLRQDEHLARLPHSAATT